MDTGVAHKVHGDAGIIPRRRGGESRAAGVLTKALLRGARVVVASRIEVGEIGDWCLLDLELELGPELELGHSQDITDNYSSWV